MVPINKNAIDTAVTISGLTIGIFVTVITVPLNARLRSRLIPSAAIVPITVENSDAVTAIIKE